MTERVIGELESRPDIKRPTLPLWQNGLVILLTLAYLICELAFNSRLLDLVGSLSTSDDIHGIERYGRALTAIAAALLVFQLVLAGNARLKKRGVTFPALWVASMVFSLCLLTGVVTWQTVEWVIERQVAQSTGEFRQKSILAQLYQQSLIDGHQTLEGIPLDDDGSQRETWTSPSGKAFLAMLPLLMSSVSRYHELLEREAAQNLRDSISVQEGGILGYYKRWLAARGEIYKDYLSYNSVMQKKVIYNGVTIPARLSWEAFFMLEVVQKGLREKLTLPLQIRVRPEYPKDDALKQFALELQAPHLDYAVQQQLPRLQAALASYGAGGANEKRGEDAARAVIVPPIALMFSLLGALTHVAKLLYLLLLPLSAALLYITAWRPVRLLNRHPLIFPVMLLCLLLSLCSLMNNSITASPAYHSLRHALQGAEVSIADAPSSLSGGTLLRVIHAVSIGQSYSYPLNHALRQNVLLGFDFGYATRNE
ncbi:hypothetical protein MXM41_06535 [Leclercia adecarboxylata]|uniref:hypothetical protein n=1 Tax=Leclercia adecarboxylata TaxID=83655 RepID=UPI002DBBFFC8|nr:hypothetical protein [Leclercia adecarboxylata]MEB6378594.1 hypothetical protein [Leclercia adecarboxylata]